MVPNKKRVALRRYPELQENSREENGPVEKITPAWESIQEKRRVGD